MPIRLCLDCGIEPAVYRGRCKTDARTADKAVNRAGYRVYRTKRWRILRDRFLFENPICDHCSTLATDVHHRTDIADGGAPYDQQNLQALCHGCHARITGTRQHSGSQHR